MSKLNEGVKSNHYISGPLFWLILKEYYEACEAFESFEVQEKAKEDEERKKAKENEEQEASQEVADEAEEPYQYLYLNTKEYRHLKNVRDRKLNECGKPLIKMINGLSNNAKFSGYTWKDEMVADAYIKCTKALVGRKYKLFVKMKNGGRYNLLEDGTYLEVENGLGEYDKYNPFSYFNRIAWREFLRRNRLEKEYVETRNEYIENHRSDFKEGDDTPIYVKPNFASTLGDFYNEENWVLVEED